MNTAEKMYATVRILDVPYCLDREYEYYIPPTMTESIETGVLVMVPFGRANRKMTAIVVKISSECEYDDVKPIAEVSAQGSILSVDAMELCTFLCGYTLCTFGDALKTVVPAAALSKIDVSYAISEKEVLPAKLHSNEKALLLYNYIRARGSVSAKKLRAEFGDDAQTLAATLVKLGCVIADAKVEDTKNNKYVTYISLAEGESVDTSAFRSTVQRDIVEILRKTGRITTDELYIRLSKRATPQVSSLEKKGIVVLEKLEEYRNSYIDDCEIKDDKNELCEEQTQAYETLCGLYKSGKASAALLHGVTGSGKTRVIKAMIDRVIADGRGVIMLVPEISLTPQTVGFFCGCYGDRVAVIHSGLSRGERYDAWKRIRRGDADIVIGTRSAVFAPLDNIGMIVIDEEQEHTYKSDTSPKYSAHDIARFRAGKHNSLMLLSSATPSLTSYYKAATGVYTLVEMKNRYGGAKLPEVQIADMRGESEKGNQSPIGTYLADALKKNFERKKQSIVFLNRRGYNSAVSCRICGEAIKCPNCSVSLTYHATSPIGDTKSAEDYLRVRAERGKLSCHYCGYRTDVPKICPSCSAEHFRYVGCGTEQAEEELKKLLPEATVLRMDTDTTSTKNSYRDILDRFRRGDADVLLGTQMVTKGHDFPNVTLVGVMNADGGLFLDDFKAGEKTFSMLTQVVGRAGRSKDSGLAVVQTSNPDSDIITLAAKQDYKTYYEKEIRLRRALIFPPFCDIAVITLSSDNESILQASSKTLSERLKELLSGEYADVKAMVFGPFEAPVYKVQNNCRMRVVVKCKLSKRTRMVFATILHEFSKAATKNLFVGVDFNPSSL